MSGKPHDQDLFRPRSPGGSRTGTAAAVLVHLLLVGAIALGVNWRSSEPDGVSAELWSAVPQAAAPRATTTEAEPPAPPKPKPEPAPAPPPPPPPPRPEPAARAEADAQIAIEARRKEDARKKAELEEQREQERKKQREEAQKEEQRLAKERERQKAQRELKAQKEREAKEREEAEAEALAEKKRDEQEAQKKKQAAAAAAAENARLEAQRKQALERIKGMAGASGGPTDTGSAAQSSGPSSSYGGRIRARVKPNIVFNEQVDGNPVAEVEVRLAPDGRILSQRLVRSSGVRAWDEAVQRAVERTEVFPRDVDGRVPSVPILLTFRPRD